VFIIQLLIEEI